MPIVQTVVTEEEEKRYAELQALALDYARSGETDSLAAMVRHGLPIVVVVFNNRMWGATRHFQELISGPDRFTGTELADTRYDLVAAGFGCHGEHVARIEDLGPAMKRAFQSGLPACVNVATELALIPPDGQLLLSAM